MTNTYAHAIDKCITALTALKGDAPSTSAETTTAQAENALAGIEFVKKTYTAVMAMICEMAEEAGDMGNNRPTARELENVASHEALDDALYDAKCWAEEVEDEPDPDEARDLREAYDDAMFEDYRDRRNEREDA